MGKAKVIAVSLEANSNLSVTNITGSLKEPLIVLETKPQ